MKQIIGAQLYTLRDHLKTEADFIASMERLRKMGFEYVQFSGVNAPMKPERVREILDANDLKIACSHMPWNRLLNETEKVAEENAIMGVPVVGLSAYPENKLETKEDFMHYLAQIIKIGEVIKQYGMKFGIHNHTYEFHRFDGKSILQHTREQTDPDAIEFIFCCFWAMFSGADPVQYLYEFKNRISCCHYKDMTMLAGERTYEAVGSGNMNYKAIWKACEETGVKHALIEQDICHKDAFESMADSRDYMLKLGEEYDKECR